MFTISDPPPPPPLTFTCTSSHPSPTFPYFSSSFFLHATPSRLAGYSIEREITERRDVCRAVCVVGKKLRFPHRVIMTACLYLHRYFCRHSLTPARHDVAAAALFLAGKMEEAPRRISDILESYQSYLRGDDIKMDRESESYQCMRDTVLTYESALLTANDFIFRLDHIHDYVLLMMKRIYAKTMHAVMLHHDKTPSTSITAPTLNEKLIANQDQLYQITRTSWFLSQQMMLTPLCLFHQPQILATVCVYLASLYHRIDINQLTYQAFQHVSYISTHLNGTTSTSSATSTSTSSSTSTSTSTAPVITSTPSASPMDIPPPLPHASSTSSSTSSIPSSSSSTSSDGMKEWYESFVPISPSTLQSIASDLLSTCDTHTIIRDLIHTFTLARTGRMTSDSSSTTTPATPDDEITSTRMLKLTAPFPITQLLPPPPAPKRLPNGTHPPRDLSSRPRSPSRSPPRRPLRPRRRSRSPNSPSRSRSRSISPSRRKSPKRYDEKRYDDKRYDEYGRNRSREREYSRYESSRRDYDRDSSRRHSRERDTSRDHHRDTGPQRWRPPDTRPRSSYFNNQPERRRHSRSRSRERDGYRRRLPTR